MNRRLEEANKELTELNQEMQASYEEALLSTEEAQASTEEVETLNEELQAANEELETLNEELQATIEELNTTNDDLLARSAELQELARIREEEQQKISEASRRRLQDILTQAPSMIAVLAGPEHVFELANPNYLRGMGRTEEQILGKTIRQAFPELEGQGLYEALDQVYETGEPYVATEASVRLDREGAAEEFFFDLTFWPLRNPEGEIEGVIAHQANRTEQVRSRQRTEELAEQLQSERSRLETILLSMRDAVLAVDTEGEVLFSNDLFKQMFGEETEADAELLGDFVPLNQNGERFQPQATLRARAARGESFRMNFTAALDDGELRRFEARGEPIVDDEVRGGVIVIRAREETERPGDD
jgi:PAS domain S-box-containing protein